jgi:dUTP pyrophosphatase
MIVKVKKLHPDAVIPKYSQVGDAGLDLTAVSVEYNEFKNQYVFDTGLAFEIPVGHVGLLFPRSSISKKNHRLANSVGVIDSNYRGPVKLVFDGKSRSTGEIYQVGDRIGQIIILPYPSIELEEAEELSDTSRGAGGFGSTGN